MARCTSYNSGGFRCELERGHEGHHRGPYAGRWSTEYETVVWPRRKRDKAKNPLIQARKEAAMSNRKANDKFPRCTNTDRRGVCMYAGSCLECSSNRARYNAAHRAEVERAIAARAARGRHLVTRTPNGDETPVEGEMTCARLYTGTGFWVDLESIDRDNDGGVTIRAEVCFEIEPVAGNCIRIRPRR